MQLRGIELQRRRLFERDSLRLNPGASWGRVYWESDLDIAHSVQAYQCALSVLGVYYRSVAEQLDDYPRARVEGCQ